MFCHGLGDCFLLAFSRGDKRPLYVVVDCGVIAGTSDSKEKMETVVDGLTDSLGPEKTIDLLVVTHEHWDHVSGFTQATEKWRELTISRLWFSWTEDPIDNLAGQLSERRAMALSAIANAFDHPGRAMDEVREEVGTYLSFFGLEEGEGAEETFAFEAGFAATGRIGRTKKALETTRTFLAAGLEAEYRRPRDRAIPLVEGVVEVTTLGPPQDEKKLKRSDPSRKTPEVYSLFGREGDLLGIRNALGFNTGNQGRGIQPFDESLMFPRAEKCREVQDMEDVYADDERRQIDAVWWGAIETLALDLDSDTNNTSLALAFHLIQEDIYLLFPGDAQVGNWLSWGDQDYVLGGGRKVGFSDILEKTVLYKVGHHGSHNATLRERGLELMNHAYLCAMVPVDKKMARKKRWKEMPFESLIKRLGEKTQGRTHLADAAKALAPFVPGPACARFGGRPLYVELQLPLQAGS
jgi:hypothetical protein